MRPALQPTTAIDLQLPPAPLDLGKAEAAAAEADNALKAAQRSLTIARGKKTFTGEDLATPAEIEAAEIKFSEAKAALDATLARRNRLRHEYEADARQALGAALLALDDDIKATLDHLMARLAEAKALDRDSRAAGIRLGAPLLVAADRLAGIGKIIGNALLMVKRP